MRFQALCLAALVAAQMSAMGAHADPRVIAIATLPAGGSDRSEATAGALENGNPGNLFGGIGSGLAWLGGDRFAALPDRGPNARDYNPKVDNTTSYIPRFHDIAMALTPATPDAGLPFTVTPHLVSTTLLSSATPLTYGDGVEAGLAPGAPALNTADRFYFSGRSDNFDATKASSNPANARLDPEGIRGDPDGALYISDEYGPALYRFDRDGQRTKTYDLPANLAVAHPAATGPVEDAGNTSGRSGNKGMEGLAITPDGTTLVGLMQGPLLQDGGAKAGVTRIVTVDIATGVTHQYAYPLDNIGSADAPKYSGVNEIVAINNHAFLVDERDSKGMGDGSNAKVKRIYRIDLTGAATVDDLAGEAALKDKAVTKSLAVDLLAVAQAAGVTPDKMPAKIEGMTFGPDITLDGQILHTLWISSDNDFMDDPSLIFVVALSDADLPGYAAAQ